MLPDVRARTGGIVSEYPLNPERVLRDRIAELEEQLEEADEMNAALEWLDNGYVVRAAAKLSRLDTAQRVYADLRARAKEGGEG